MDDLVRLQSDRIAELEERIRQLEEIVFDSVALPIEWRLTANEARMFAVLMKRHIASKQHMMTALYSDRAGDPPDEKIIDIFICKMRKKLRPHGVDVQTVWGQGWALAERVHYFRNFGPKEHAA